MVILILSIEGDESTADVMDWLAYYGKKCIRINQFSPIDIEARIGLEGDIILGIGNNQISLNAISSFWYRQGNITLRQYFAHTLNNSRERKVVSRHIDNEREILVEYINVELGSKKSIGSNANANLNKLATLQKAKLAGLCIPETIITTRKQQVISFLKKHRRIICKTISENINISYNDGFAQIFTEEIDLELLNTLPENFPHSLFQERLNKKYEIRTFYLNGRFFSMANILISYAKDLTDIRKLNLGANYRSVPFNLPPIIESKLKILMDNIGLKSGSIDMCVTTEMEYVFFEINPIGQYKANSVYCNYSLDKEIANFLANE